MSSRDIKWSEAHKVACDPEVHEALKLFSEDSTEDSAVALVQSILGASRQAQEAELDARTERATMRLLGKESDPAPGVNWKCNRYWTVRRVRNLMREILRGEIFGVQEFEPTRPSLSAQLGAEAGGRQSCESTGAGRAVRSAHGEGSTTAGEPA